eukprot:1267549-Prymnesium_polylepis.2
MPVDGEAHAGWGHSARHVWATVWGQCGPVGPWARGPVGRHRARRPRGERRDHRTRVGPSVAWVAIGESVAW